MTTATYDQPYRHDLADGASDVAAVVTPGARKARRARMRADCVLIVTDHKAVDWKMVAQHGKLVVDSRNAMAPFQPIAGHYVPA